MKFLLPLKTSITGDHVFAYYTMITCNALIPQLFWLKKVRKNIALVFIISIFINLGMWFERYVIIVTSLNKDYLPSAWSGYSPTWVEIGIYTGTLGIFALFIVMFFKYCPHDGN